jgi:hypothetical protein
MKKLETSTTIYVEEASAKAMPLDQLNKALIELSASQKEVKFVATLPSLSSVRLAISKLKEVELDAAVAALQVTAKDRSAEDALLAIKKLVSEINFKPELGIYKFSGESPNTRDVARFSKTTANVRYNQWDDSYSITIAAFEKVAALAVACWLADIKGPKSIAVSTKRNAVVRAEGVTIGCQSYSRGTCEAVLVKLGYLTAEGDILLNLTTF